MGKQIKKLDIEVIEQVFKNLNLEHHYNAFMTEVINEQTKADKLNADLKAEEAKHRDVYYVKPEIPEEFDSIEEYLEFLMDEECYDLFADEEIEDSGADITEYFMVADKLYEVEMHCEAEWIGDWSVRANVPGDKSITSIKEIKDFEFLLKEEHYAKIKLK